MHIKSQQASTYDTTSDVHFCAVEGTRSQAKLQYGCECTAVRLQALNCTFVVMYRSQELSTDLKHTMARMVHCDSKSVLDVYRNAQVPAPGDSYHLSVSDLYHLEFVRPVPNKSYNVLGEHHKERLSYAEGECAEHLELWTVAALCR